VTGVARHLLPWARGSLILVVPTGVMMFAAHATEMAQNPAFRLKLLLIVSAGSNAAIFHRGIFKTVDAWNVNLPAPPGAKIAAVLSLVLWTSVIGCGRLLAYL